MGQRPTARQVEDRLARVRSALAPFAPDRVIVFGSVARGEWHEASDIDLLIVKTTDRPFFERLREVYLLLPADIAVEALVYTPQELERMTARGNGFIARAMREGREI